jgi:ABC-2 type transport system permease protein
VPKLTHEEKRMSASDDKPAYLAVYLTFLRNSLVRDLSFRSNFVIECIASVSWMLMNLGFYLLVFQYTTSIGSGTGWGKHEFFVFLATTMLINSIVQAFFMPNAEEFSELIRKGGLDFALLKPIDTQFLISCQRVDWSALTNFCFGLILLVYGMWNLLTRPENPLQLHPLAVVLYPIYILCGVAMLYSLTIALAAITIWMGRNQSIYDFWFYITNFSRYPMEIYNGKVGDPMRWFFSFVIPILLVVNVPARLLAWPFHREGATSTLPIFALIATLISLIGSRWIFTRALRSYRSASS